MNRACPLQRTGCSENVPSPGRQWPQTAEYKPNLSPAWMELEVRIILRMNSMARVASWMEFRRAAAAFRDRSIRAKLWLLIIMATVLALGLAGGGFFLSETVESRRAAIRELSALAEIVSTGSGAPLSFNDPAAARELLANLHSDQRLLLA